MAPRAHGDEVDALLQLGGIDHLAELSVTSGGAEATRADQRAALLAEALEAVGRAAGGGEIDLAVAVHVAAGVQLEERLVAVGPHVAQRVRVEQPHRPGAQPHFEAASR